MKKVKWILIVLAGLFIVYRVGPSVEPVDLSKPPISLPSDLNELEASIDREEKNNPQIKPDNESRIIWADSTHQKTPYSMIYLHGWSASQEEGDPVHEEVARRYGMNLYLPRLAGHGLEEEDPMANLTATQFMESAWKALEVGKQLGEKVIIMATSTGGTLGLYMASQDPAIAGMILYSPNVDMKDPTSHLLNDPWGLQVARLVVGGNYYHWEVDSTRRSYWTNTYRLEALTHLRELVDETMTPETFHKVTQPVFLGYYYKNEEEQDNTVSVSAMRDMYGQLGTPEELKKQVAFPNAQHHVIASHLTGQDLDAVRKETYDFLDNVLRLPRIN